MIRLYKSMYSLYIADYKPMHSLPIGLYGPTNLYNEYIADQRLPSISYILSVCLQTAYTYHVTSIRIRSL